MIKKINHIETVDVELSEINEHLHLIHQNNGLYLNNKLPCKFEITASFKMNHYCSNCGEKVFGRHNGYFAYALGYISTKFYKKDFVSEFINFFRNTTSLCIDNDIYIYDDWIDYNPIMPSAGSIEPIYYQCEFCKAEYICNRLFVSPCYADPPAKLTEEFGFISYKEIIQIELENQKTFGEWESDNRIYKDNILGRD